MDVARELQFAARTLRKSPGFTIATVVTLALGISANSAMFSIVNGVLLEPLPFERSNRLVVIYARDAKGQQAYVSQPDLDDWRAMTRSFSGLSSWVGQSINLTGLDQPQRIAGAFVSANFFPVLGVSPAMGHNFSPGGDRPGAERQAIITYQLWRSRFGSNPAILGSSVQLNGEPYAVIGVLSPKFVFPFMDADVFLPAFKYPNYSLDRRQSSCSVIGRLREGVAITAAQGEMDAVAARLASSYPVSNKGQGASVVSLKEDAIADLRPSVAALAGAVVFVLLIACANVAGLLVARMISRERERAVRIALGAGRMRLMLHVLAEALLLAAAGCGLGLLLGVWSVPAIASVVAPYLPYGTTVRLDQTVVLFTVGISIAAALLVAAIPAWQSSHVELLRAGRSAGAGASRNRARSILVASEIALALVLLVGAGLMIKSLSQLGRARPGFDAHNLLMLAYRVPQPKYPSGAQQTQFHREVVAKITALPGVVDATSVRAVPLGGNGSNTDFFLTDRPEPPAAEHPRALLNFVDPHFFATMRIPVAAGRTFSEHDETGRPLVIVINETLARLYFNGRNPTGERLRLQSVQKTAEIIGVVGDVKQFTLKDPPAPQIYGALAQNPFIFTSVAVRTTGDPLRMVNQIRRAIWDVDKDQPVWSVHSFEEVIQTQARFRRMITLMLGLYAAVALALACIGIFGVISYTVSQRTAEIGVRMALGARPGDVARLIVRQGLMLTLFGTAAGMGAAAWLSRYLRSQLYDVTALDFSVYGVMAALLAGVAVAACLIPARRASKVDPMIALRYE